MLNDKIKELRISRNLTQPELAKILGVSRPTVTKYESGEREPDYQMLAKIADYFGVSTDYLLEYDSPEALDQKKIKLADDVLHLLIKKKVITSIDDLNKDKVTWLLNILEKTIDIANIK